MTAGAVGFAFPRRSTRRYTQVRPNRKIRHFGRDAEIQAMDGNKSFLQMLDSGNMPSCSFMFAVTGASFVAPSLPSLDAGFRHPCRNDGIPTLDALTMRAGAWERASLGSMDGKALLPGRLCNLDTGDPCRYDGCKGSERLHQVRYSLSGLPIK